MRPAQESSVEKFGAVHTKVKEGDNKQETTRGASLRELQHFFEKEDSSKGYAGLRRIADEDGTAVWTILEESEVTTKLEERAEQRKQEERRHEEIFSTQARAPLGTTGAAWKEAEERLRAELKAEMIATAALKEQEAPLNADPEAVIGGRNTGQEADTDLAKLLQQHKDEIVSQVETKLETMIAATMEKRLEMQAKGVGGEPSQGVAEQLSIDQAAGNLTEPRRRQTEQQKEKQDCVMS